MTDKKTLALNSPEMECFFLFLWGESRVESAVSDRWRSSRRRRRWFRFLNIDRTKEASMEFKKCMCFSLVQNGFVSLNCTCDSMGRSIQNQEPNRSWKKKKNYEMHFSDGFGSECRFVGLITLVFIDRFSEEPIGSPLLFAAFPFFPSLKREYRLTHKAFSLLAFLLSHVF